MENTSATLDFPLAKTAPSNYAFLQTTLQKVADLTPRWAISVVDGSFFLPLITVKC